MSRLYAVLRAAGQRLAVRRAGYSLMEILVAVAIIAVLATLVAPRLFGQLDRARVTSAEAQIDMLETALDSMRLDIGRYPTTEEGLELLRSPAPDVANTWYGPYLDEELPTDPWGNPYRYQAAESQTDRGQVFSLGADNEEGGSGLDADIGI